MANVLTKNPWEIDTVTSFSLCTDLRVRIKHIRWVGATTAGHLCELVDVDSNIIWRGQASGANYTESDLHHNEVAVNTPLGLRASAIQSGRVFVTYG